MIDFKVKKPKPIEIYVFIGISCCYVISIGEPCRQVNSILIGFICHISKPAYYGEPIETKTIICIDCGRDVEVDARNMTKIRCDNCQKEHRKKYDRDRKRKIK